MRPTSVQQRRDLEIIKGCKHADCKRTTSSSKLKVIWRCRNFNMKTKLHPTTFCSHFNRLACLQSWTFNKDLEKRILAFENNCCCVQKSVVGALRTQLVSFSHLYNDLPNNIRSSIRLFGDRCLCTIQRNKK